MYIDFVRAGVGLPSLWANLRGQMYLGGEVFVEQMAALAEGNAEALEVPRVQRRPRALPLSYFVSAYADPKRAQWGQILNLDRPAGLACLGQISKLDAIVSGSHRPSHGQATAGRAHRGVYHVDRRGNARAAIDLDAADRVAFLDVLAEVVQRHGWLCHAYCLMDNHYHLLIETPHGYLSAGLRRLNGRDTQRFNRRQGRVEHLLQGRHKAIFVDRDAYLLEPCRYVGLYPVRAGMGSATLPGRAWQNYSGRGGATRRPRNQAIVEACLKHRDAQAEVARHLGLHYSTISKVLKRLTS